MGEKYTPHLNEEDLQEDEEGILEAQFDLDIVEDNLKVFEQKDTPYGNITSDMSLHPQRNRMEIGGELAAWGLRDAFVNKATGKISRFTGRFIGEKTEKEEMAKGNIPITFKVASLSNRYTILSFQASREEGLSREAQINIKKTIDEFNRIWMERAEKSK